jgi:methyl-accepting chemotaxis protein
MRLAVTLLALAVLVGVAASCGGDDEAEGDPTAAWASDFCTAITGWRDELDSIASRFSDASNLSEESLRTAADDARSATDELVDELRDLGRPETPSGEAVESAVDGLSTTLEDEVAEIEETADGVSGLTDLPGAISAITASLAAMSTAFSGALTAISESDAEGELRAALDDSPECDEISSSTSG